MFVFMFETAKLQVYLYMFQNLLHNVYYHRQ